VKAGSQVSVIIPVYNGERYLAEAVHSILAQTVPTLEIIVVDDGSTDGTARVAQRFGDAVCYVYQPNRGPAAARNRGLERARGVPPGRWRLIWDPALKSFAMPAPAAGPAQRSRIRSPTAAAGGGGLGATG